MLLETLQDTHNYMKSTLLSCLQETVGHDGQPLSSSYKTLLRKERKGIEVYKKVHRDPTTNWRMYSGRLIREIVDFELEQSAKKSKDAEAKAEEETLEQELEREKNAW
jgi:hypothetical protein